MERTGSPHGGGGNHREQDTIRDLPLQEVDDSDKSLQFRLNEEASSLLQSLRRDGQITPIKVIAGARSYQIIDGFRRTAAARELGWATIRAVIYPPMLADEAKKIAFVANVVRRNLTIIEKANAIQMARQEGYTKADVATMFGISQRQIERYLALPEDVLQMIDGREITMAHARVIADQRETMSREQLRELAERVRAEGMSAPELQRWLLERGLSRTSADKTRTLGNITRDRVQVHRIELKRDSSVESREKTAAFLRLALQRIEEFGAADRGDGASDTVSELGA